MSALGKPAFVPRRPDRREGPTGGDRIDRLAALYQRARLWRRRTLRLLAESVAAGNAPGAQAARARYRRASHWEMVLYERYIHAVLSEYSCCPGKAVSLNVSAR